MEPERPRTVELPRHLPSLDTLRGIAVGAAVLSHLHFVLNADPNSHHVTGLAWLDRLFIRGFLGVDLFFVISGFLITSLLLRDSPAGGTGRTLRRFWARRALRLLPALAVLLTASWVVALAESFPIEKQWRTTWRALLFVSNVDPQSNFFKMQNDIGHLWSLAVEEQFYLVLPPLLLLVIVRLRPSTRILLTCAAIAAIVVHRTRVWETGTPWLFVFPRTDLRADTLLAGCLAAFVHRDIRLPRRALAPIACVCVATLAVVAYCWGNLDAGFLYRGGFTLVAGLIAVILLAVVRAESSTPGSLPVRAMRSLGRRSYGMYLYHLLIFFVVRRHAPVDNGLLLIVLSLGLSWATTVVSWKFLEEPILRYKDRRFSDVGATVRIARG